MRDVSKHKGLEGESAEELFAKVAWTNKHSEYVADTVYAKLTPKEDAMLAKHNFLRLMGEPVRFPTGDVWKKQGTDIDAIKGWFRGGQGDPDDEPQKHGSDDGDDEEEDDEEDDDEIAAALFGGTDDHVLVDDVADNAEAQSDIDPEDNEKDEWGHIIAICDDACDEAMQTLTQEADMSPARVAHENHGIAKAAADSPTSMRIATSQLAAGKSGSLGKHTRTLQRRISMEKTDKKKKAESRKRNQNKLR